MYAWIWRHLPFGLPGKVTGSVLLFAGAVSLLWFYVFPATAPFVEDWLLPFDGSTIEGPGSGPGAEFDDGSDPGLVDPEHDEDVPEDPHEIPYDVGE